MSYIGKSPTQGVRQRYYFTATGGETSLSGADDNGVVLVFTDGAYVDVYLNGVLLVAGTDYNTTTKNTIGGLAALAASDIVEIIVYDVFTLPDAVKASTGGTFGGTVNWVDNAKATFGAGSDLQIYHDGINSYIDDTGSGDMLIRGSARVLLRKAGTTENMIRAEADSYVKLYYDNAEKLATTSTGVDVTGTVTATAFSGDGSGLTGIAGFPSGTLMLFQQTAAPTGWTKQTTHNNKALRVVSGTAGTGGSVAFTTALGTPSVSGSVSVSGNISSTTLSTSQIPSHSHSYQSSRASNTQTTSANQGGTRLRSYNTGNTGGSGSHNHGHNLAGSLSSASTTINVQYVDLIIAAKD